MPELPEVETIVNDLSKKILSLRIVSVFCYLNRMVEGPSISSINRVLKGVRIKGIKRKGKYIIFFFNEVPLVLIIHLGMSGQLIFNKSFSSVKGFDKKNSKKKNNFLDDGSTFKTLTGLKIFRPGFFMEIDKHCHFIIEFEKKQALIFRDTRTFGKVIFSDKDTWQLHPRIKKLGVEPLTTTTAKIIKIWPKKVNRCVKALLLDQSILAGVGNIYADEALFLAGIHPQTKGADLTEKALKKLINKVKVVLKKGIKNFGTTFSNYIQPDGEIGSHYENLNVYGRQGKPCKNCKKILVKSKVAGRGSVFCLHCQSLFQ